MSTAYLVAHAYTDPSGKMLPQIHSVRIYNESGMGLGVSLDVYSIRADDYQAALDLLCYTVQTLDAFAWCRPLMDPRAMVPIDYLRLEVLAKSTEVLRGVLCKVLRCSEEEARRIIVSGRGPLVRTSAIAAINACRDARAWLKRDFDALKAKTS